MAELTAEPPDQPESPASRISNLPDEELNTLVKKHAKYKARSQETHHNDHLPALATASSDSFDVILVGDSRLERFAWYVPTSQMNNIPRSFNAGVGGDKIENALYRIDEGLLRAMDKQAPKLWVVSVGTNNLRVKGREGLREPEMEAFIVLLSALLRASKESRILITELSYRTDISDEIVGTVNGQLQDAMRQFNIAANADRVLWSPLPRLTKGGHLLDHVHFNEEGYRLWDEKLYAEVQSFLDS